MPWNAGHCERVRESPRRHGMGVPYACMADFEGADRPSMARNTVSSGSAGAMVVGVCTYNRGPKIKRTLEAIRRDGHVGGPADPGDRGGQQLHRCDRECGSGVHHVLDGHTDHAGTGTGAGTGGRTQAGVPGNGEPIVAFLDDDCLPDRGWPGALLSCLDAERAPGMVGGRVELVWEEPPTRLAMATVSAWHIRTLAQHVHDWSIRSILQGRRWRCGGAIEQSGILASGVLSGRAGKSLTSGEDYEIGVRLRRAGFEAWYEPSAVRSPHSSRTHAPGVHSCV